MEVKQIIHNLPEGLQPRKNYRQYFNFETYHNTNGKFKNKILEIGKKITPNYRIMPNSDLANAANLLLQKVTGHGNEKGLYLCGDKGTGKTTLFKVFNEMLKEAKMYDNLFEIVSIDAIVEAIRNNTYDRYLYNINNNSEFRNRNPKHLLINEFGKKTKEMYYGTDIDKQIERFLMIRYEIFTDYHKVTHVTSNINPIDLDYNELILDRMVEMFDVLYVSGESLRK